MKRNRVKGGFQGEKEGKENQNNKRKKRNKSKIHSWEDFKRRGK